MALTLSNNRLYGAGYSLRSNNKDQFYSNLSRVKGNTPFGYYDNDPEFIKDAMRATAFVAQRMGVSGTGDGTGGCSITDLTVYAAIEEAVTTYGNMVYQYKVRDNYINLEGSDTLPFTQTETADKIVLSLDDTINSPVFWSKSRTATWAEIGFDVPNSSSAAGGEIYVSSASLNDFIAPDLTRLGNFNFFFYQNPDFPVGENFDWSQTTYPQFNKVAGETITTVNYSSSFTTFDTTDLSIFTSTPGSSSFSITGSNGSEFLFVVTASDLPSDTSNVFYISTGSTVNDTAFNIANKINSVTNNFGLQITVNTGSTPVVLDVTSSFGSTINPVGSGFEINYIDNSDTPQQVVFTTVPDTWDTYQITEGKSYVYFFVTAKLQDYFYEADNRSLSFADALLKTINTSYYQDVMKGRNLNGKLLNNNLATQIRLAEGYAQEAGIGGYVTEYTGSLILTPGQQVYDLNAWAAASASLENGDSIEIRQVFYQEPPAIVRYFDPYAGTGTGVQGLLETFGFGSYSPGINFMLMPVYWDIQKIQAIEFNDQVRKSAYSFDLVNNQLRLFPVPTGEFGPNYLLFKYIKISDKYKPSTDARPNVVSDIMNTPFRNPIYTNINQIGRSWIFRYTLALCKEIEGQLRAAVPSVQGNLLVQGAELLTDARAEKTELLTELKEYLDQTTRRSQLERKQQEAEFTRQSMNNIPLLIYSF
jgi:hypothetical protein